MEGTGETDSPVRWSPCEVDGVFRDHPDQPPALRLRENQATSSREGRVKIPLPPPESPGEPAHYRPELLRVESRVTNELDEMAVAAA